MQKAEVSEFRTIFKEPVAADAVVAYTATSSAARVSVTISSPTDIQAANLSVSPAVTISKQAD
jgi:hypothetical protein